MWFWPSDLPSGEDSYCLFDLHMALRVLLAFGRVHNFPRSENHVNTYCVWYTIHRGPNPNIRESLSFKQLIVLFILSFVRLSAALSWAFPLPEAELQIGEIQYW